MTATKAPRLTKAQQFALATLTNANKELIPWRTAKQCGAAAKDMERLVRLGLAETRKDIRLGHLYMLKVERRGTGIPG